MEDDVYLKVLTKFGFNQAFIAALLNSNVEVHLIHILSSIEIHCIPFPC